MDLVWGIAQSTGMPEMVMNSLSSFMEVPKTAHNEFNEYIAKQNGRKAEEIYQKEIDIIESNKNKWPRELTQEDPNYILMKNQVLTFYNRAEIALLTLDYVSACCNRIDKTLGSLKEIIQQYKQPKLSASFEKNDISSLESLANFLEDIKVNLGATLQTKYHYERGGSMLSRWSKHSSSQSMRFDDWGVTTFPALELKTNTGIVSWLKSQELGNPLFTDVLKVYNQYICTIGFILKPEDIIILDLDEVGGINYYREQLVKIFGENEVSTVVKLHSKVFGINDKSISKPKEENNEESNEES